MGTLGKVSLPGKGRGKKPTNTELLKCVIAEGADDARHQAAPPIRLRQAAPERCRMSICRKVIDEADGTNEVARSRAESEICGGQAEGPLAPIEPPVGVRLCVGKRNGRQVVNDFRIGEVLKLTIQVQIAGIAWLNLRRLQLALGVVLKYPSRATQQKAGNDDGHNRA